MWPVDVFAVFYGIFDVLQWFITDEWGSIMFVITFYFDETNKNTL